MQSDQNHVLDILPRLRQATAALHREVDSLAPLGQPKPSLADYLAQLQFNYVWMRDLQAALTLAGQLPAEWLAHNALCLQQLQQDLAAAGVANIDKASTGTANNDKADDAITQSAAHLSHALPHALALPQGLGASWGAQYVIEGSFLGSSVLYQRLRPSLPLDCPMVFFSARHASTGERWRSFKQALESHLLSDTMTQQSRLREAEQGAKAAFAHFLNILQAQPAMASAKASDERQRYA